MLTTRRAVSSNEQLGPARKRKWEQQGSTSSRVRRQVAAIVSDSRARPRQRWLQREEDEEGVVGGDCSSKGGWLQWGSDKEAKEEGESSGSPARATVAGEAGGCGVNVRSAHRWLWLRAREAAALADDRSRGERRGLCASGATAEEGVAAVVVEEGRAVTMCDCCGRRVGEEEAEEAAAGSSGRQMSAEVD
ncbi:hypothetical protein B296_00032263 [Ensete ventricosum]|uniref:Uncharacterized protein n=1 Tax=Ensete ventricosum TaxID=4639 RepID=A0A426Z2I7_ENSVE|nr:hypothetical protein B296_00032263 [Ensete ventricosum]